MHETIDDSQGAIIKVHVPPCNNLLTMCQHCNMHNSIRYSSCFRYWDCHRQQSMDYFDRFERHPFQWYTERCARIVLAPPVTLSIGVVWLVRRIPIQNEIVYIWRFCFFFCWVHDENSRDQFGGENETEIKQWAHNNKYLPDCECPLKVPDLRMTN